MYVESTKREITSIAARPIDTVIGSCSCGLLPGENHRHAAKLHSYARCEGLVTAVSYPPRPSSGDHVILTNINLIFGIHVHDQIITIYTCIHLF